MQGPIRSAPGGPGIPARWTSSAKTGVGTALSDNSHVWFTLSHGIFNEIYYPRIDQAWTRRPCRFFWSIWPVAQMH
jgi:glucoamylase